MTTEEISKRLQLIRELKWDDEVAHSEEDELYRDFIGYVASLNGYLPDLAAKAKLVLESREIGFCRWCA